MELESSSPALTLPEAIDRYRKQLLRWMRITFRHGSRVGREAEWGIVTTARVAAQADDLLTPQLYEALGFGPGEYKAKLLKELGSWLLTVIESKNADRQLENLAVCVTAPTVPNDSEANQPEKRFLNALGSFLDDKSNSSVPTLAQIRARMNEAENLPKISAEGLRKIVRRLGWDDLPRQGAGRPAKTSPTKKKKRG